MKIDCVAPPFSGHLYPLIELMTPLKDHPDYQIRFITGPQKIPLLESLGFEALPILADHPDALEQIANPDQVIGHSPRALWAQFQQTLKVFPIVMGELRAYFTERQTDLVISDFVAAPAGVVCQALEIPWITTIPTPFAIETRAGTPSYMGGLMHADSRLTRLRDVYARFAVRCFKRMIGWLCRREFAKWGVQIYRPDGTESVYSPHSILGLGMAEFEFPRDWPVAFRFIGPCCASPEVITSLDIPFGDYQRSVLVSLGTHILWAKQDLIQRVSWLARRRPDVLFVISLNQPVERVPEQAANVIALEYIPYTQYLERFDAVIHHGGAGITYNCIKYQKPALVIPHDYDQFDFAARIIYNQIGVKAQRIDSPDALRGLDTILANPFREQLAVRGEQLHAYEPHRELERELERFRSLLGYDHSTTITQR